MEGIISRFDLWIEELIPDFRAVLEKVHDLDHSFLKLTEGLFKFAYRIDLLLGNPKIRRNYRWFLRGPNGEYGDEADQDDIAKIKSMLAQLGMQNREKFLTALRFLALYTNKLSLLRSDTQSAEALQYAELIMFPKGLNGEYAKVDGVEAANIIRNARCPNPAPGGDDLTGMDAAFFLWRQHRDQERVKRQKAQREKRKVVIPIIPPIEMGLPMAARSGLAGTPHTDQTTGFAQLSGHLRNYRVWVDLERETHNYTGVYLVQLKFNADEPGIIDSATVLMRQQ